jgi:hypothetical protein
MPKFNPAVLLDEQMYLSGDTQNTLMYQIREEAKETNRLLRKLVEQNQPAADEQIDKTPEQDVNDGADQKPAEPPESPVADAETPKVKVDKMAKKQE